MQYRLRKATLQDCSALEALIARSARLLNAGDYTPEQIEGALQGAFGVDTQLIRDGTFFVIERDGTIVGCGGWSYRRTPFGSDSGAERDISELDPRTDAARIRAFFIDPSHARRGLGTRLLDQCEQGAGARGFSRVELTATLAGERLYAARGYVGSRRLQYDVAPGVTIEFIPMGKSLNAGRQEGDS